MSEHTNSICAASCSPITVKKPWKDSIVRSFPGAGNSGHVISLQHPHEDAIEEAKLLPFEYCCWRHTFGPPTAQSGMDRFSLARLMGHSSPAVAARYYVRVTETHVAA